MVGAGGGGGVVGWVLPPLLPPPHPAIAAPATIRPTQLFRIITILHIIKKAHYMKDNAK
jgi:hypothetical protein